MAYIRSSTARLGVFYFMILILPIGALLSMAPIPQDLKYHGFADQSLLLGIPRFFDVTSNIFFVAVAFFGFHQLVQNRKLQGSISVSKFFFLIGVLLVAPGSAYYHWEPNNQRLLWDRLPMVIGFCSLASWLLTSYFQIQKEKLFLAGLNIVGLMSLAYWVQFDDLRFYYWVQLAPIILLIYLSAFAGNHFNHQGFIFGAFGLYLAAKATELYDHQIYQAIGFSGHSVKHILSAAAVLMLIYLDVRERDLSLPNP